MLNGFNTPEQYDLYLADSERDELERQRWEDRQWCPYPQKPSHLAGPEAINEAKAAVALVVLSSLRGVVGQRLLVAPNKRRARDCDAIRDRALETLNRHARTYGGSMDEMLKAVYSI